MASFSERPVWSHPIVMRTARSPGTPNLFRSQQGEDTVGYVNGTLWGALREAEGQAMGEAGTSWPAIGGTW